MTWAMPPVARDQLVSFESPLEGAFRTIISYAWWTRLCGRWTEGRSRRGITAHWEPGRFIRGC